MSWLKALAAGLVLAVQIAVAPAVAADMPKGYPPATLPPPAYTPPPRAFDIYSGWYVRGDLGYGWGRLNDVQSAPGFTDPTNNKLGGAPTGAVGVGIKRDWLRTDLTADYLSDMKYQGTVAAPNDVTAKISAWTALFNGYLDLGSWYRVTPYIGGGVGAARLRISDFQSTAPTPVVAGSSNAQWNFAWAAMAGVGFVVAPNMIADVGYRYLNLGDIKTAAAASGTMTFKNVAAHEVRVGLRWSFDDLPAVR